MRFHSSPTLFRVSRILILFAAVSKPVHYTPMLCVQWKTPDDGQRNCPKHVQFHSKNKFEKLVQLVGFIIRNLSRRTVTWTPKKVVILFNNAFPLFTNAVSREQDPDPARSCQQTSTLYINAVCTAKNSWWWTEELSETCRVSFQK